MKILAQHFNLEDYIEKDSISEPPISIRGSSVRDEGDQGQPYFGVDYASEPDRTVEQHLDIFPEDCIDLTCTPFN